MGLREDKRQRRRAALIENAIALFRAHGFDSVKVRDIARGSRVSEATFFNYFPTKDAVLSDWAVAKLEHAFAAVGEASLRSAVRGLAQRLAGEVLEDLDFARGAWARARLGELPTPPAIVPLLERAQQEGELRRDVDATELARLLAATAGTTIAHWLEHHGGTAVAPPPGDSSLDVRLRAALDLVLDGARRRHERVRLAAAASARPLTPVP